VTNVTQITLFICAQFILLWIYLKRDTGYVLLRNSNITFLRLIHVLKINCKYVFSSPLLTLLTAMYYHDTWIKILVLYIMLLANILSLYLALMSVHKLARHSCNHYVSVCIQTTTLITYSRRWRWLLKDRSALFSARAPQKHYNSLQHLLYTLFRKIAKSFITSVLPSVCPSAWNNSAPAGRIFRKYDICVFFEKVSR
jgi:hypothetical protein